MRNVTYPRRGVSLALLGGAVLLSSHSALGHIELLNPEPRFPGQDSPSQLKQAPCGQVPNERTDKVAVYEPGETIEVSWLEYTDHVSYYRIAFDVDGDDDFPLRPSMSVSPDGDDPTIINPVGDVVLHYYLDDQIASPEMTYTTEVTLPDVECENCTLQLIQFMYDRPDPYYFQCADLALRRTGAGGSGGTAGAGGDLGMGGVAGMAQGGSAGGAGVSGMGGDLGLGGAAGSMMMGGAAGSLGQGGSMVGMGGAGVAGTSAGGVGVAGSGTAGTGVVAASPSPKSSCSVGTAPREASRWGWLAASLGLLGLRRRRLVERR